MSELNPQPTIVLTEHAKIHISTMAPPDYALRIAVVGGGCSGLSYKMQFVEESSIKQEDHVEDLELFKVVIDPKSLLFLKGTVMDYDFGLNGKGITFNNPLSKHSCGCGKSFC
jgi:iron-sulfur cluster assembly protein